MSRRKSVPSPGEMTCAAKHRYASERIALIRAGQLTRARGVHLYVYRCPRCKKWHLTRWARVADDFEVVA